MPSKAATPPRRRSSPVETPAVVSAADHINVGELYDIAAAIDWANERCTSDTTVKIMIYDVDSSLLGVVEWSDEDKAAFVPTGWKS